MFSGQNNTVSFSNSVYCIDSTVLHSNSDYSSNCNSSSFSKTGTDPCQEMLTYQELDQDETDDLLYHFGNYFREKLNKEVKNFCGSMSSMFDEQQIHVKQIVSAARNEIKELSVPGVSSSSDGSAFKQNDIPAINKSYPESYQNEQKICEESKERYIIRLLTLSSVISSTLH